MLKKSSRRGLKWAPDKYQTLITTATDAKVIGANPSLFTNKVKWFSENYSFLSSQIEDLTNEIFDYINNTSFSDTFNENLELLSSFKGIRKMTAITLLTEIGEIYNFFAAQKLVAFFGVDPSANESGNFKSDKNKMSKRGTSIGRRVLYALALSYIR